MWFYLGLGRPHAPVQELATVATSTYRLPLVVMDLILDVEGRGVYEILDRVPELAERGYHGNPHSRLRTDLGGVLRTSFCPPEFGACHLFFGEDSKKRGWSDPLGCRAPPVPPARRAP